VSAVPNGKGRLAIAVCPDCNTHSVCDPNWLNSVGSMLDCECENCITNVDDPPKFKPHMIVAFIREEGK